MRRELHLVQSGKQEALRRQQMELQLRAQSIEKQTTQLRHPVAMADVQPRELGRMESRAGHIMDGVVEKMGDYRAAVDARRSAQLLALQKKRSRKRQFKKQSEGRGRRAVAGAGAVVGQTSVLWS